MKLAEITTYYGFGVLTTSVGLLGYNKTLSITMMSAVFVLGGVCFHYFLK